MFELTMATESETTSVSEDRIEAIIREVLRHRFPDETNRQRVIKRRDRFNFCCPYCGDSSSSKKKRGNLYPDTLHYVCYNGGCEKHADLLKFARDFSADALLSQDEILALKGKIALSRESMRMEKVRRSEASFDSLTKDLEGVMVKRSDLMTRMQLMDVHPKSQMGAYLSKRMQTIDNRFAWNPRRNQLYIFNMDAKQEYVFGLQTRQFDGGTKYLTYNLSGIWTKMMGKTEPEFLEKLKKYDHVSTAFNALTVDFSQMVTVFEGPLDSFLFPNSVALCSIGNEWPFDVEDYRWFQDNDEAGRKKALAVLEIGKSVFLWKKLIEEHGLQDKRIKDYNDLVVVGLSSGSMFGNLDSYFSTHRFDGIYL